MSVKGSQGQYALKWRCKKLGQESPQLNIQVICGLVYGIGVVVAGMVWSCALQPNACGCCRVLLQKS